MVDQENKEYMKVEKPALFMGAGYVSVNKLVRNEFN